MALALEIIGFFAYMHGEKSSDNLPIFRCNLPMA
jgi:hypothetical protein